MKFSSNIRMSYGIAVLAILLIPLSSVFGQFDCPQNDGPCGSWTPVATTFMEVTAGCYADVDLERRQCNGIWQFRYRVVSVSGSCDFLTEFELYQYKFSALKEFMDLNIILRAESGFDMDIPLCSDPDNSKKKIVQMYSAACGIWVKCTYPVSSTTPISCDEGADPHELPDNTLDRWEFVSCGEACCMRTYDVCQSAAVGTDPGEINITAHTTTRLGDCSLQSEFGNNPCMDGCQGP